MSAPMRIVISFEGVKRVVLAPFEICGSREDIAQIASQLADQLRDPTWSYGWVGLYDKVPVKANTPPISWTEQA